MIKNNIRDNLGKYLVSSVIGVALGYWVPYIGLLYLTVLFAYWGFSTILEK